MSQINQSEGQKVADPNAVQMDNNASQEKSRDSRKNDSRGRSRSSSHHRSHRRRSRSRSDSRDSRRRRERSRSRREKNRSRSRDRNRSRESRRQAPKEEDNEESLTRDIRTVFVSDLQVKVDEKWLRRYFEQAGTVKSIKLIRDRNSNRSKGMGYIEMATQEDAAKALMLNGQKMCTKHKACNCSGFPMKVKRSEAEKNWSAMKERAPPKIQPSTIRVCGLHPELSRRDIIELFETIGDVDNVEMDLDERKEFRGNANIKFRRPECASRAAIKMDGQDVLGHKISVSLLEPRNRNRRYNDDDQNENIVLDPQRRSLMMRHIAENKNDKGLIDMMNRVNHTTTVLGGAPKIEGNVSNCLVLKNMFLPALEQDPRWDINIQEDVTSECMKMGKLLHCYVDKNSNGNVYVMFDDTESGQRAAKMLVGRNYGGRLIEIAYMPMGEYVNRFPDARRAASIAQAKMANAM